MRAAVFCVYRRCGERLFLHRVAAEQDGRGVTTCRGVLAGVREKGWVMLSTGRRLSVAGMCVGAGLIAAGQATAQDARSATESSAEASAESQAQAQSARPAREPLPAGVEAMILKAAESGDAAKIDSVADVAKAAFPGHETQIGALASGLKADIEQERVEELKSRTLLEGWKGSIEAGFNKTTGNTDETGTLFQVDTVREGVTTRQRINALHDRQKTDGD